MIIVARRVGAYEKTSNWTNKRGIEKSHKELSAVKLAVGGARLYESVLLLLHMG